MPTLMETLHPANSPGEFDLVTLLNHDPPVAWRPSEPGDSVLGVVLRMMEANRADYTFPMLELMDSQGRVIRVRASAMVLKNKIHDLGIGPGMVIQITLTGKKVSQSSGREYRTFDVKVA